MNPGELTPVSLSARLLSRPVLHWKAASSTDNPQTMSNTDSSSALHGDIGETLTTEELKRCFNSDILLCLGQIHCERKLGEKLLSSVCGEGYLPGDINQSQV